MMWMLVEMLAVLVPLFHGAGAVLAAHAAMTGRTSQGAIAWAMSLVFFPYVAVPLYLVLGRSRFVGYVETRREGDRRIDHVANNFIAAMKPARAELSDECRARFGVLEAVALLPFSRGNQARLLVDGEATFAAIFAAIEKAEKYLLVQFFIVRDDALGQKLRDALAERAKAGVKVYFIYDEVGCFGLSRKFIGSFRAAGIEMVPFNTRRGWRNRFQINFRNHRKIVVVDGVKAFVGGHNVGIEYLGKAARFGHWRDTHVEITGPAVTGLQWSFVEDWHWATGEILETAAHTFPEIPPVGPGIEEGMTALIVDTGPADEASNCSLMFLALITAARKRLWITSPYFVPDETTYDALQLAALRGVDVRILLPAKPDHKMVYLASFSYLETAELVGVKFYRYQDGFLHQKVLLVDEALAAVGTANLDNRSMKLNFEITSFFLDEAFAAEVAGMLESDFSKALRVTSGDLKRRGILFRVAVRISRLFSPIQ